jgi:hypothetical protein
MGQRWNSKNGEEGMKKYLAAIAILAIVLSGSGRAFSQSDSAVEDLSKPAGHEPPMLGIHWARGFEPNFLAKHAAQGLAHRKGTSVNMLWHNGSILTTAVTENIFWGTSWGTYSGDKITGMDTWYTGFSGSNYSATSNEYTGTNGQIVEAATSHLGHVMDTSAASGGGYSAGSTKLDYLKAIDHLLELRGSEERIAIVVDEAQVLNDDVLEELGLLWNRGQRDDSTSRKSFWWANLNSSSG